MPETNKDNNPRIDNLRWIAITIVALSLSVGVVALILWRIGFFDFSGTESAAKVIASGITLLGTFFTAMMTFVGLVLKRSLDLRNLALKREAEKRLKLDTAIKAVELFKDASGNASSSEAAGALFGLTSLGESHFALRLLEHLWPKNQVETPAAIWVINRCLQSENPDIQELAAELLKDNASRLPDGLGYKVWPSAFSIEWNPSLSYFARESLLWARIHALLSKDFDYWKLSAFNLDIVWLSIILDTDPSPTIREGCAAFLSKILKIYDSQEDRKLVLPTRELPIEVLRSNIETSYGSSFYAGNDIQQELARRLEEWIEQPSEKKGEPKTETG